MGRAVLLGDPKAPTSQLIRVGGKLAVLGVEDGPAAMTWWHILRPGSWTPTQDNTGLGLTYGTSLCKRRVVTNGYAADHRPPKGVFCPACAEQV